MNDKKIIGVVGGMGPYAGLDLVRKILDQSEAKNDQGHLSIALLSFPGEIEDRTSFLIGQSKINPAFAICDIIHKLEEIGAAVVGIPCNAAHAPQIFNVVRKELKKIHSKVQLVHMIEEVMRFMRENYSAIRKVGILCTTGTYTSRLYPSFLEQENICVIEINGDTQRTVHSSVYDPSYGIKVKANPVSEAAKMKLLSVIHELQKKEAQAIILGCTEMVLAITEKIIGETIIIDPTLILARALIRVVSPNKLKPC